MSLHTPSVSGVVNIIPADTFADIPFDVTTGKFTLSGSFGSFQAGQQILTLDDGNIYQVVPDGSGGLTLMNPTGRLLVGVIGTSAPPLATVPRGFLLTQDTGGGSPQLYVTNIAGFAIQAVTLRTANVGDHVPLLTGGVGLAVIVNGVAIMPGQSITAANGKAQLVGARPIGVSVDSATRTGDVGGTVMVKMFVSPLGN